MALDLAHLPAADDQPPEKFKFEPWMFAVLLAVVLIVGAIVVGYLRSKSSNAAATTPTSGATSAAAGPPLQVVNTSGNDVVNQSAFDDLESNLGTTFGALQSSNAQIGTDEGQIGTLQGQNAGLTAQATALTAQISNLQTQLQAAAAQGQDITALTAQITALQAQLTALANRPQPTPAPAPTPVTSAPPPQSNGSYVTVAPWPAQLSTLWGIAQSQYGNGALWPRIANANPWISNPNIIQPGWRIFVPR